MGLFEEAPLPEAEAIRRAGHHGIHNFTIGTLTTYFGLETARISFHDDVLIIDGLPGSSPRKVFVYRGMQNTVALDALQKTSVIYSIDKLDLPKQSRFKELAYSLPEVFDPASYPNARKRHKRLVQPSKRLAAHRISISPLGPSRQMHVADLHKRWCTWKLDNPATFKMMFPKRRYMNCVEIALKHPGQYAIFGAFSFEDDKLLAVRVLYIEGEQAFDLACFSAAWETYSNFSEDFYIETLRQLKDRGISYVNCGSTLSKQLGAFKAHWPHQYVESWAYGRIKD